MQSKEQKAAEKFAEAQHRKLRIKTYGVDPNGVPYCNELEGDFGSWNDWEKELKRAFLAGDKKGYARGYADGKQIYVCAVCGKEEKRDKPKKKEARKK